MITLKFLPSLPSREAQMGYCQALAAVLVLLSRRKCLDLPQVARQTKITYHSLFGYERGKRKPPLATLKVLSHL
jgi:hypothetical protein